MNSKAQRKIQSELDPGEHLYWAGTPTRLPSLKKSFFIITFYIILPLLNYHIFGFEYYVDLFKNSGMIPYILLGGYLISGFISIFNTLISDPIRRGMTYYGLTNHRAIIISEYGVKKVKSIDVPLFHSAELKYTFMPRSCIGFGQNEEFEFTGIENAREVYDLFREIQNRQAAGNRS